MHAAIELIFSLKKEAQDKVNYIEERIAKQRERIMAIETDIDLFNKEVEEHLLMINELEEVAAVLTYYRK